MKPYKISGHSDNNQSIFFLQGIKVVQMSRNFQLSILTNNKRFIPKKSNGFGLGLVWTTFSKKSNVCIFMLRKFMPPTTATGRISVVGIVISRHSIQIHLDLFIQPISENNKLMLRHLKFLPND